jgi:hypothetical protein
MKYTYSKVEDNISLLICIFPDLFFKKVWVLHNFQFVSANLYVVSIYAGGNCNLESWRL